jgi:hypothetical protein
MMTDTPPEIHEANQRKLRKFIVSLLIGAVIGGLGSAGVLFLLEASSRESLTASGAIAATVGVMYIIIGIGVGFGALRPALGEQYLNVEDAEELRETRPMLTYSSLAMMLWGAALVVLAFAGHAGPIETSVALAIILPCLAIGSYTAWKSYLCSDELMAALNLEGSAIAFFLTFLTLAGWGMAAHLAVIPGPSPLDLVTSFFVFSLLATFIAIGRRGMLAPK